MTKQLTVGIAGYGVVGPRRRHYIDQHPAFKTVAVCDRSFASDGTFPDGVRYYSNYNALLEENIDVLFVCLTHDVAPEVTIAGLKKGFHVFCEKPPGRDISDIQRVIAMERECPKLKLKYGFNHRYHDSVRDALKFIESGNLGKIINMRGVYGKSYIAGRDNSWRSQRALAGGGILLDQGIHMLDLMLLFAGESFSEVKSFVSNSFWKHDVEDNAYALMRTQSGIIGMLHSTATQWRHRFSLEIAMTEGSITLAGILSGTKSYGQETLNIAYRKDFEEQGNPREQITSYVRDSSWKLEVDEFAECILKDQAIRIGTSQHALEAMRTVYRVYCGDEAWSDTYNLKSENANPVIPRETESRAPGDLRGTYE